MTRILQGFLISLAGTLLLSLFSCREDPFELSPDVQLHFSNDSILFDTVFSTIGTTTQWLVVYNNHPRRILIDRISLRGGSASMFRFNADGRSGPEVRNLEIAANDSIFLFVEATIDPNNQNLPFIITDSLEFSINSRKHFVNLIAWGQNAHFIRPDRIDPVTNARYHLISGNTTWNDTLPYVIFGLAVVDSATTLSITQGAHIYFHNNSSLVISKGASLKVAGTIERRVVFQGDRNERFFENLPGQWGRIWLRAGSGNHDINYAIIKNGTVGLHADSTGSLGNPFLRIRNTVIKNKSLAGIMAFGSHIAGENLVVANCGKHLLYLALGGTYEFRHCTFANFYNLPGAPARRTPSVVFNNYFRAADGSHQYRPFGRILVSNSIIFGNMSEELHFDLMNGSTLPILVDHSLLRTSGLFISPNFVNVKVNLSPQFRDVPGLDFRLKANSPAIRAGNPTTGLEVPYDLLGRKRTFPPDMGAYQYFPADDE